VPRKSIWPVCLSMLQPDLRSRRAVSLYEKAWQDGVPIAAFELGQLYERGVPGAAETVACCTSAGPSKAWSWYRKGADIGEPQLARTVRGARPRVRRYRELDRRSWTRSC
jgi:hypothetical protein